jgi:two-component system chemotaxis response regulator CheB
MPRILIVDDSPTIRKMVRASLRALESFESEASCVVYGMPRSIVEAGLSDGEVMLDRMADALMARV